MAEKFTLTNEEKAELRGLLAPEKIVHEEARAGSRLLLGLGDDKLCAVFVLICLKKKKEVLRASLPYLPPMTDGDEKAYTAALRRLSLVGQGLALRIRQRREEERQDAREKLDEPLATLSAQPGLKLREHIEKARLADRGMDCVKKMSGLASLLEQQLEDLYTYPTREAQPFMGVKHVNMVAQTYSNTLAQLHKMQMDVGLVEKMPEKMEVNMRQIGAFQTYVGELTQDQKDAMSNFSEAFGKMALARANGQPAE